MKRTRQPLMRRTPPATRADRPDLGPEELSPVMKTWKSAWALTRWVLLVLLIGLGAAAAIAIALAAFFTLVDSSL